MAQRGLGVAHREPPGIALPPPLWQGEGMRRGRPPLGIHATLCVFLLTLCWAETPADRPPLLPPRHSCILGTSSNMANVLGNTFENKASERGHALKWRGSTLRPAPRASIAIACRRQGRRWEPGLRPAPGSAPRHDPANCSSPNPRRAGPGPALERQWQADGGQPRPPTRSDYDLPGGGGRALALCQVGGAANPHHRPTACIPCPPACSMRPS